MQERGHSRGAGTTLAPANHEDRPPGHLGHSPVSVRSGARPSRGIPERQSPRPGRLNPMAPRVDPVRSDEALPAQGRCRDHRRRDHRHQHGAVSRQKGVRTVLCEKGHIAGEQSSRNWGWCRKMGRDPRELPLIIESLRLWQGMNELVEAETGFRQAGIMYLAESQAELGAARILARACPPVPARYPHASAAPKPRS